MAKVKACAVYFEQVNQTRYTVKARPEEAAVAKAEKMWKADFRSPECCSVEVDGDCRGNVNA